MARASGHQDHQIYLHFVEGHAEQQFAEAQKAELQELARPISTGRQAGD